MKRKILFLIILTLLFSSAVIPSGSAATPAQIHDSIVDGLEWLAIQQQPDGRWSASYPGAYTGLAVLKFIDAAQEFGVVDWTDPAYIYHDVVVDGLNWLFSQGFYYAIGPQPAGDPDTLPNGHGITFTGFDDYEVSCVLMALGATMTPGLIVTAPGPLNGVSYADVVQDVVDYLAYWQREHPIARGGWGYEGDIDWADNSVSGYASLGLGYAQDFGATIPQFVKDELLIWINSIQDPSGYSYYRPLSSGWPAVYGDPLLRTGNLLFEMALVGLPVGDARVQSALTWIESNWAMPVPYYQRAFCLMKGLEGYGITNEITVGVSGDWYTELADMIVGSQILPAGNWPGDPHDNYDSVNAISASWALLTLEKAVAQAYDPLNLMKDDGLPGNAIPVGGTITYTISYENTNPFPVNNVVITDPLPPEVTYLGSSGGGVYNGGTHTVTWTIGPLAPGDTGSVTVTVRVDSIPPSALLYNYAFINSDETTETETTVVTWVVPGQVIPEIPLGTISALTTLLASTGIFYLRKRH